MTHCVDFYHKWKREPNFCGMGKQSARTIEKYLDLVGELSETSGLPESLIYVNAPCGAVKNILRFKKGGELRSMAIRKIGTTLKDKKAITAKYVNNILGIGNDTKPLKSPINPVALQAAISTAENTTVRDKERLISDLFTAGQKGIILDVMQKKGFDSKYEALSHLLIRGKEAIDNE